MEVVLQVNSWAWVVRAKERRARRGGSEVCISGSGDAG